MNGRDTLIALAIHYKGDWKEVCDAVRRKEYLSEEEASRCLASLKSKVLTILDDEYPVGLREIYQPPFVLFYYGNVGLIRSFDRCVAIVGSRDASEYGKGMARTLAKQLSEDGFSVVSGLAKGIDTEAARGALPNGKAVAVIGNGIDYFYPPCNSDLQRFIARDGLLLSEYPGLVSPSPDHFPTRNRIVAGLCTMTVVAEAKPHSGTMITAAHCLAMNRNLGAVPYRAEDGSACNALIKDGACMVEGVEDIFDEIGFLANR